MFDFFIIQGWLLIFARASSFVAVAPFFSMQGVPALVKIGFSFILSVVLLPLVPFSPLEDISLPAWWFLVTKEVVVGLTLAFLANMVFAAIRMAGEIIDIQMGFAMASVLDPQTQTRTTLMGQFKYMLAILIFLAVDGHHVLISALAHSYTLVPVANVVIDPVISLYILKTFVGMFALAFKIAAPIIAVLIIADIALGLVARTVPQLNVFILGFPLKTGLGMFAVALVLPLLATIVGYLLSQLERDLITVMEILAQ
ncbi:flagellar biosynthetic protein FliR [Desulfitibacter alkalitolerans]|uniref:flagellar biosynthetic protein FliR n=1 Tax=Desulfitibacter alkalitolerans TaxID=264641 RepID=UPI00055746F7|nr:flagellar biosynthetic protein FliR [Desulfitibacter alkalitolerans]